MYLYNSATHKKEEFRTHTPGHVEMYTCGPTVYHFAHIGNLRSYIMEDVLEKYLRYVGYDVNRVMNITDVGHLTSDADEGEDKMLKGARREHKTVMEIAQFYTDAFFEDCRKLNIKRPDVVQPATGLIDDYIRIISRLLEKGYAYVAGGNVYFDTSKLERYYVFNDHNEEDLAVGVREGVEEDVNKRNKNDFVLWFTKSKFEDQALKWDSPWGVGYPGWHIECSGISMKYNGEYLDLHCGGVDNAFPHHTNEIAQSESYLGHPWCPQWCHVAHLNTSSGKMSKSKGEFLTVSLLEEKGYAPVVYRFFCLQSHYRKSLVFSWENLDNAAVAYGKLIAKIAALPEEDGAVDMAAAAPLQQKFRTAMDNDLNTSMAVTVLYDVLKAKTNGATKRYVLADFDRVLSLDLLENAARKKAEQKQTTPASGGFQIVSESGETDAQVEALLQARYDAKKAKDFTEADRIRDDLKAMGVEITDIPGGVRWKSLHIILKESRRLTNMVEELLEFSKMQDGRFTLRIEDVDLQTEFEDAVYTYQELFRQDGIRLEYDDDGELYADPIPGDPERLKQVLCNVLDNAAKHGGSGKRIIASLRREADNYVIRIRDFGPGIPPAELPYVKQKFYKGSSKARGSGIGLAVCDEIITRHGGTFEIGNADGGGALVTITLPIPPHTEHR